MSSIHTHPKAHTVIKDIHGVYMFVSPEALDGYNINNINDVLGGTDLELPWDEPNAELWMEVDKRVMKTNKSEHVILPICRHGITEWIRTYRSPLLGRSGNVQGISAMAIPIQTKSLIQLTNQQSACLKELALGFTHKQIGQTLGLAQKTVEHYLDAVKLKLNCKSRAELIMQAIERGLISFL